MLPDLIWSYAPNTLQEEMEAIFIRKDDGATEREVFDWNS